MNRADFQALADIRIAEAQALLGTNPPFPAGAYYLAGYAVECALKALICKKFKEHDWPDKKFVDDCHTHDIMKLVRHAELKSALDADMAASVDFGHNWDIVRTYAVAPFSILRIFAVLLA